MQHILHHCHASEFQVENGSPDKVLNKSVRCHPIRCPVRFAWGAQPRWIRCCSLLGCQSPLPRRRQTIPFVEPAGGRRAHQVNHARITPVRTVN